MPLSDDIHDIPRLFGDAAEQLGKLVQNEAELARAEMAQKLSQAALGAAYLAGAAILITPTLVMLLLAFAVGLVRFGVAPVWSYVIAAAAGAVVSGILAAVGLSYFKAKNLKPTVTLQQVQRDLAAAKEMTR